MPPYDSDSSDDGDAYTETNVLLGYASKDDSSDPVSHLGGHATWLDGQTAPSGVLAKCRVCHGLLTLLLELNGDLPERFPGHERRLYLWGCRRKTCRRKDGSVRGLRGLRVTQDAAARPAEEPGKKPAMARPSPPPLAQLGESLFGVKSETANPFANPFAANGAAEARANPFATKPPAIKVTEDQKADDATAVLPETFASKVRISTPPPTSQPARPHEPWPADSTFPPPYPQYYLDAEYETLDAPSKPQIPDNARMDVDADGVGGGGKEDKDVFESSLDKTFQKFADRVGQNPEQVLRYEYGGKPLLYSDSDTVGKLLAPHSEKAASSSNAKITTAASRDGSGMPRCSNCGADRVFEVQLTPHAIAELEAEDLGIDGMEWGTIILGVCSKDCMPRDMSEGQVGYMEEWVGVQWEEVASKR